MKTLGWECQSCRRFTAQESMPVNCEHCLELDGYVPRWREIRDHPDPRRRRSGMMMPTFRQRVYARDNFECVCCGESNKGELTLDHIHPKSKGGASGLDNYQTLCRTCNRKKADKMPAPGATLPADLLSIAA